MSKKLSSWPLIAPKEVDTSITSDQVMEALASDVEASDSGKVLTATYGGLEGEETASVMWASPLPFIGEGDAGKVLTVNAGETGAEWEAAEGGAVNLDAITTEIQTAAMTASGNADTSGFFGVSLSMFGNETTVEIANLITEAARAGKISALGKTFTLVSYIIDEEYPPNAAGMEAYTTISFLVPVMPLGLSKYYTLAVQIDTADKRDQQTDEYVPTLAVSCWAMKIANYPSNG